MKRKEPAEAQNARRRLGIDTEGRIMSAIRHGRETTISAIVKKTGFTRSRVHHALKRLDAKGQIVITSANPHVIVKASSSWELLKTVLPSDEYEELLKSIKVEQAITEDTKMR